MEARVNKRDHQTIAAGPDINVDGFELANAVVPEVLRAMTTTAIARREKRLKALRSLHQRTRAEQLRHGAK